MEFLHQLFAPFCGQQHSWWVGDLLLPFCQRCTGLYVGGAVAAVLCLLFRPRPTRAILWVHGGFLLLMIPFGYHLVPQNSEIRMLTGQLFSFGLVYFLTLNPVFDNGRWKPALGERPGAYATGAALCILLTQLAVHYGGAGAAEVLAWSGFTGLIAFAALTVATVAAYTPGVHPRTAPNSAGG